MEVRAIPRHCEERSDKAIHKKVSKMEKQSFIYIMANQKNGTLYVGVTNDLIRRVYEHKNKLIKGFTEKYDLIKLVYYEIFENIEAAIKREKQLKGGFRQRKLDLINNFNKDWEDLYEQLL